MIRRGVAMYGDFPRQWIGAAEKFASARERSNSERLQHHDRGEANNLRGNLVGMLGERLAQLHRPDLGVDPKRLYSSGATAPKVDGTSGIDIKSAPMGRARILINQRQASDTGIVGVVIVLVDVDDARFWLSPVVPIGEIRSWPVFAGPYGDPAYYQLQRELLTDRFPIPGI